MTALLIVPDANALYSDPFLEGPLIRAILTAENHTDLELAVPAVVIDELRGHVERRLENLVKDADKVRRDRAWLSGVYSVDSDMTLEQRQAVLDRFDQRVEQLDDKPWRILDYPFIMAEELVQRSIRIQPPFQEKDRGLRDTIIWLTVKEHLSLFATIPKIALVTKDGAFWDKNKTKLNESLTEELKHAGIPCDSVIVLPTLESVVDKFLHGKLSDADWIKARIENSEIDDFTDSNSSALLSAAIWIDEHPDIFDDLQGGIVRGYSFVQFKRMKEVSFERLSEAFDLGSGEVVVTSEWTGTAVVSGYGSPYPSDHLDVALRFTMGSLIEAMDELVLVRRHDVSDTIVDSS